ncbi:hypothetical protein [Nonomuraea sp. GTA35]|uniref:hypothetical protein n=1 Tax=Nonomuraea sp. GTA35 TaxID=1676746 RepID=UPI0035BFC7C3
MVSLDVARTAGSWGSLPLALISASGDQPAIARHRQIAAVSARGRHAVAPTDDHDPHLAEPALVLRHIRQIGRQGKPVMRARPGRLEKRCGG